MAATLPPRVELENQVNDAFNAALLMELAVQDALRQSDESEATEDRVSLRLNRDQVTALEHAVVLTVSASRDAKDAIYVWSASGRFR